MPPTLRMAQVGTRHGHAEGKWLALCANPDVEAAGLWEPDVAARSSILGGAHWFDSESEVLDDASIVGVAIEGRNHESLAMALSAAEAGKHLWFDKPAGDDWPGFLRLLEYAAARHLHVQMGYMFRYSPGFQQIADWVRGGVLGDVFSIRAHMSTRVDLAERTQQSRHRGGIFYDLGGHMIDQLVWLLGRPETVRAVLRNDATPQLPEYVDNAAVVFEFQSALAVVDIAAMEVSPAARRFEVYGTRGSAILEPFDLACRLRFTLEDPSGEQVFMLPALTRQELYSRELAAFVGAVRGERSADRSLDHEQLVQETLLRATGGLHI
jgi:predicted dehydrogenase